MKMASEVLAMFLVIVVLTVFVNLIMMAIVLESVGWLIVLLVLAFSFLGVVDAGFR
jgi:hypothetical protein